MPPPQLKDSEINSDELGNLSLTAKLAGILPPWAIIGIRAGSIPLNPLPTLPLANVNLRGFDIIVRTDVVHGLD